MGLTYSPVTITNLFDRTKVIQCDALVDTGASYLTLPTAWQDRLGKLDLIRQTEILIATQERVPADVYGPVKVELEGFPAAYTEAIFIEMEAEDGGYEPLVGCLVLEAAGIAVDPVSQRLMKGRVLARAALPAVSKQPVEGGQRAMTYSEFTLENIQTEFGLVIQQDKLFDSVEAVAAPQWLTGSLKNGLPMGLASEKARSEFIVAPVLLAGREVSGYKFYIYSGQRLDADAAHGLTGECDFILTHSRPTPIMTAPIMTLVEAKKNDIELGLGQCIAQMLGAQVFNKTKGKPIEVIFGCVTTGEDWQFIKLAGSDVVLDTKRYYISNIEQILGVLKRIVESFEQVQKAA